MTRVVVQLNVEVFDKWALWVAAHHHLTQPDNNPGDEELLELIGPETDPDVAACVSIMTGLFENVPGVELVGTITDYGDTIA